MLPRTQRLTTKALNTVMEKGRVVHSPLFLLRILPGQGETRLSGVAPQKIFKKAVERTKTRRRIYNGVRPILHGIHAGTHIVLIAKKAVAEKTAVEIRSDLESVFAKAGIIK